MAAHAEPADCDTSSAGPDALGPGHERRNTVHSNNNGLLAIIAMGVIGLLALGVVAAALLIPATRSGDTARAQGTQPAPTDAAKTSQITVRGSGTVSVKPDTLKMSIGIAQQ